MNVVCLRRARSVASAVACAVLILACATEIGCDTYSGTYSAGGQTNNKSNAVAPVQDPLLEGIPLPSGFRFMPERSLGRSSGQFRVFTHEYSGDMAPPLVIRWYKEYMPSAGFTLRQERHQAGEYELRFDSNMEECDVHVKRDKLKTVLVVDVGPLPKGSTQHEKKPAQRRP